MKPPKLAFEIRLRNGRSTDSHFATRAATMSCIMYSKPGIGLSRSTMFSRPLFSTIVRVGQSHPATLATPCRDVFSSSIFASIDCFFRIAPGLHSTTKSSYSCSSNESHVKIRLLISSCTTSLGPPERYSYDPPLDSKIIDVP